MPAFTPRDVVNGSGYIDSQDRRPDLIIASIVGSVLAVLSTLGRVAARRKIGASLQADDYWIFGGLVCAIGVVASTLVMVHFGLGRHINLVTDPPGLAQSVVSAQILYALSVIPIKLSILFLYHRIFPSRNLKWVCIAIGAVVVMYSVALAICMGLQCVPLSHIWEPEEPGTCIDADTLYTVMAVVNVATDFAILALPLPYIWRLSLQKARKIQLMGVFLLGALVCAFGIIRAVSVGTASIEDQSWNDVPGAMWSVLEICIGVLSANLPCLRPLMLWLPAVLRGSTTHSGGLYGREEGGGGRGGIGGHPNYALSSSKRHSTHVNTYELGSRAKMMPGGSGRKDGWDSLDRSSNSDIYPFAAEAAATAPTMTMASSTAQRLSNDDDDHVDKGGMRTMVHSLGNDTRSSSRSSDEPKAGGLRAARGASPLSPHAREIMVETRIETRYD